MIFVLLLLFYYSRASYSLSKMEDRPLKNFGLKNIQPSMKKMAPGAACCKRSFSRTSILSSKNNKVENLSDPK